MVAEALRLSVRQVHGYSFTIKAPEVDDEPARRAAICECLGWRPYFAARCPHSSRGALRCHGPLRPSSASAHPRAYAAGVLATTVAAAAAAILTSYFGVQGTILGAIIGAAVASTASQAAQAPLSRLERRIIGSRRSVHGRQAPSSARVRIRPAQARRAAPPPRRQRVGLGTALAVAAVGFGMAMSGITAYEVAQGKPLSARAAGNSPPTTSLQQVLSAAPPAGASDSADATTPPDTQPAFVALGGMPQPAGSPAAPASPGTAVPTHVTATTATATAIPPRP